MPGPPEGCSSTNFRYNGTGPASLLPLTNSKHVTKLNSRCIFCKKKPLVPTVDPSVSFDLRLRSAFHYQNLVPPMSRSHYNNSTSKLKRTETWLRVTFRETPSKDWRCQWRKLGCLSHRISLWKHWKSCGIMSMTGQHPCCGVPTG